MKSSRKIDLNEEPVVGEYYSVPCVFGELNILHVRYPKTDFYPVLTPSHEDSKYLGTVKYKWKENEYGESSCITYHEYEPIPNAPHHFHIDPRFVPLNRYDYDVSMQQYRFHSTINASEVEYKEMKCLRRMPTQYSLYKAFGQPFINDFTGSDAKCGRCPHKKINLRNIPSKNGVITCPAHGLQFDSKTMDCLL